MLRDHPNHDPSMRGGHDMNGGMWGAVRGAVPDIRQMMYEWTDQLSYRADLDFLQRMVWPAGQAAVAPQPQ